MTDIDVDLSPMAPGPGGKQWYKYTCKTCQKEASNSFMEPIGSRMLANRQCFDCDYWADFEAINLPKRSSMTIIDGHVYGPGSRTTGSFRGMAGHRFDIEYIGESPHAGKRVTTFDLWSGAAIPDALKEKFPDTAKFLGASKESAHGITCWNPTDTRDAPYPLPITLGIK
jgi:hypothetical protein